MKCIECLYYQHLNQNDTHFCNKGKEPTRIEQKYVGEDIPCKEVDERGIYETI